MATENLGKVTLKKVDVDAVPQASADAGVEAMPSFFVFQDGAQVKGSFVRGANEDALREFVAKYKAF